MKTIIDSSRYWMDNTFQWASREHQWFVVLQVQWFTSDLVVVINYRLIGSFDRQKLWQNCHRPILRMTVNWASMTVSFASSVIYVSIGCRHLFMRYSKPLDPKTSASCSLPNPENQRQWSVSSFRSEKYGHQGIAQIFTGITVLLIPLTGKHTIYQR